MPSYNDPINYMPNIQEQERNVKLKRSLVQPLAQAEESRSSERVSRSGEGSKSWNSGLCAFSLRRDPPRLGETLARSNWAGRLSPRAKRLGRAPLISPMWDKLTWERLSVLPYYSPA